MIFRRSPFADLIRRQLDLFERDHADVLADARSRLDAYNQADRDEAEELYGDYVDAVDTGTELLAEVRDHYARTLDRDAADRYADDFNRAVSRRFPPLGVEIDG